MTHETDEYLVYLAAPYRVAPQSARDRMSLGPALAMQTMRYRGVCRVAGFLREQGAYVFSPLTHTIPVEKEIGDYGPSFWLEWDRPFMEVCDMLVIATFPGWGLSEGVFHEEQTFKRAGKPIAYYNPRRHMEPGEWRLLESIHNYRRSDA